MGDRPRHEHCERHDSPSGTEVGSVRDELDARKVVQLASTRVFKRRRRQNVLASYHFPNGRLSHRSLWILF